MTVESSPMGERERDDGGERGGKIKSRRLSAERRNKNNSLTFYYQANQHEIVKRELSS